MDANEEGGRGRISRERKDEAMGRKLKQRERRPVGLKTASRVVGVILEEFYARGADC